MNGLLFSILWFGCLFHSVKGAGTGVVPANFEQYETLLFRLVDQYPFFQVSLQEQFGLIEEIDDTYDNLGDGLPVLKAPEEERKVMAQYGKVEDLVSVLDRVGRSLDQATAAIRRTLRLSLDELAGYTAEDLDLSSLKQVIPYGQLHQYATWCNEVIDGHDQSMAFLRTVLKYYSSISEKVQKATEGRAKLPRAKSTPSSHDGQG